MLPDLSARLRGYVEEFNRNDEECYTQAVDNAHAYDFLMDEIPLVDLPDPLLEKIYYFRWWTFRKHWKQTEYGHILSEFLPPVPWAGPCNSINCAVGHHFREGRWMRDPEGWMKEYLLFWLDGHGDALRYSMWLISAAADLFSLQPDPEFEPVFLEKAAALYEKTENEHRHSLGLFWSEDGRDGMEISVSGSGLRPTLNSYMYADAVAISKLAERLDRKETAEAYAEKAASVKAAMDRYLWHDGFYRVIPCEQDKPFSGTVRPEVAPEHDVCEELGFVPWYFGIPDEDKDSAFLMLAKEKHFLSPFGITTTDRSHPRYLFDHEHECLWNGYIWPFATSQTLTALANLLHTRTTPPVDKNLYYKLLRQYAENHHLREGRRDVPWIDEVMDPRTGRWSARDILKGEGWLSERGGFERGKDYNHSTFTDLILSGLLGINAEDGKICCNPIIPDNWDHFCVTGLTRNNITVVYDRDGTHYGTGKGISIFG